MEMSVCKGVCKGPLCTVAVLQCVSLNPLLSCRLQGVTYKRYLAVGEIPHTVDGVETVLNAHVPGTQFLY
jgi:hypothetical protein